MAFVYILIIVIADYILYNVLNKTGKISIKAAVFYALFFLAFFCGIFRHFIRQTCYLLNSSPFNGCLFL